MRYAIAFAASLAIWGTAHEDGPPAPPPGQDWRLVYSDDFNGTTIDQSSWLIHGDQQRAGGWWLRNKAKLDGQGNLVLTTSAKNGLMATGGLRGKRSWLYGYFEIRCKLPKTPAGHRPAFWLQAPGTFKKGNDGRDGTEIDVFEAWSRDGKVQINLHWDVDPHGPGRTNAGFRPQQQISYNEWHTFAVWWTPDSYRFYFDGEQVWESRDGGVSQVPESMLITDEALENDKLRVLNVARADSGDPFVIDYARVYQLQPAQ